MVDDAQSRLARYSRDGDGRNLRRRSEVASIEDLLDSQGAGIESVVFADNRSLSSDEVLATILNEDEQEASR